MFGHRVAFRLGLMGNWRHLQTRDFQLTLGLCKTQQLMFYEKSSFVPKRNKYLSVGFALGKYDVMK